MRLAVTPQQIISTVTDETEISRWWTSVNRSERGGDQLRLFMGGEAPLVFTIEHIPGSRTVTWTVTSCDFLPDWVGTTPTFSVQPNEDGTCELEFHHVGLRPALECFDECQAGWDHFMPSLHRYLETGEGLPNEPRSTSA